MPKRHFRADDLLPSEITPRHVFEQRRRLLKSAAAGLAFADMRAHDGTWTVPWPREPAGQPFTVHWRAYVPASCARAPGG